MVVGLALGPVGLGALSPGIVAHLFPASSAPLRGLLSGVGVTVFVFLLGLHVDPHQLSRQSREVLVLSAATLTVPFVLGAALSLWLFSSGSRTDVGALSAALFCGCALAATALPVLGAVVREVGLSERGVGGLALTCAALQDGAVWVLLAVASSVGGDGEGFSSGQGAALSAVLGLVLLRHPLTSMAARCAPGRRHDVLVLVGLAAALFAFSWTTGRAGLHGFLGAFLLGVLVDPESLGQRVRVLVEGRLEAVVARLFLPVFFLESGLAASPLSLDDGVLLELAAVAGVAVLGKGLGVLVAAAFGAVPRGRRGVLIALLNTRGLTELLVLTVALKAGVFDAGLFTSFLLMAVLTTLLATPAAALALRRAAASLPPPGGTASPWGS